MDTATEERWAFLSPWTALLLEHKLRVKTAFLNAHTCREEFQAIEIELQPSVVEDYATHAQQQALAEALELVATALALLRDAWDALIVHQCGCHWFKPELYDHDTLLPRFELNCAYYPGEVLAADPALQFFRVLQSSTGRSALFATAKQRLLAMAGGTTPRLPPASLRIAVSTWNELPRNFLVGHVSFLQELKRTHDCSWCYVEAVAFDITGADLSSDAVNECLRLAHESPLVQFTRLTLDPKDIRCTPHELTQLVTTLVSTTPAIHLDLGELVFDSVNYNSNNHAVPDELFDHYGRNASLLIDAVAKAPVRITNMAIRRLLPRPSRGLDRNVGAWNQLLCKLLHSSAACTIENLELTSDCCLRVVEDETLNELIESARASLKTPQSLTIKPPSLETAGLRTIIQAVGSSLRHLRVSCNDHQFSSTAVPFILGACPHLKHLDLNNVELESLDVFSSGKTASQLSTLTLTNISLRKPQSLHTFLVHLADPQSHLDHELDEFVFAPGQDQLRLGSPEMSDLVRTLHQNGRLHTLHVEVDPSVSKTLLQEAAREHRRPAAVFDGPLASNSKLAVLSALADRQSVAGGAPGCTLCADVLALIFDYAAVCKPRWVNVIPR